VITSDIYDDPFGVFFWARIFLIFLKRIGVFV